jgi:hypothetical protein
MQHERKEVKEMKRIVLMLTVMALLMLAVAGPASAQWYDYCWYYDYYYGAWYWYYC